MRRFYLHKRAGIYYVELVDPETGNRLPAKSTGEREEDEARDVVREWLHTGVPNVSTRAPRAAKGVFTLASILSAIRSIDLTTPDAEKKLAHGQRLTHEYCYHSLARARRHQFPSSRANASRSSPRRISRPSRSPLRAPNSDWPPPHGTAFSS